MRQYIGARYVPKFMGVYDNTQSYEALCIVDNGMGTSYISKIPTPPNTPLTNTTYWAIYGTSSGAINNLQDQINDMNDGSVPGSLQNQIDTMNDGSVSGSLQNQISTMEDGSVSGSLQNQITSNNSNLQGQINNMNNGSVRGSLQNQIDLLRDRKIAIITDSYGDTQGGAITPFPRKFGDFLGLTENVDYVFAHINGAGFVANTTQFTDVIDDLYNNMPSGMLAEDITDLIIAGGSNDSSISSGLSAAIRNTVSYAKSLFTNAKIYVAVIAGRNLLSGRQQLLRNVIPYYMDCGRYGAIPLQYTYLAMTKKSNFLPDGIHPNQNGANDIAAALISAFFGSYTKTDYDAFTLTDYNATFTATYANARIYNDRAGIVLNTVQYRKPSVQNISSGNLTLTLFDSDYIFGNAQLWGFAYVILVGGTDDGKRLVMPVVFSNGEIILVVPQTFNVLGFNIPSFYFEVPLMNS